jgi:hypothetical protein
VEKWNVKLAHRKMLCGVMCLTPAGTLFYIYAKEKTKREKLKTNAKENLFAFFLSKDVRKPTIGVTDKSTEENNEVITSHNPCVRRHARRWAGKRNPVKPGLGTLSPSAARY